VGVLFPAGRHLIIPLATSASYLYYDYDSSGTRISVRSPGASLMSGVRVLFPRGSISAMAGGEMRQEHRNVDTFGAPQAEHTTLGVVLQSYENFALARRWQATGFGVYVGAARYFVGRADLRYQLSNIEWKMPLTYFAGVECVRQGNDASDAFQVGGVAEVNLVPSHLSLSVHSGYKESWSPGEIHQHGGYFGTSLYRRF